VRRDPDRERIVAGRLTAPTRRHGHRMFVTSNKDQAASNLVVVSDEFCSR